jgi:succinate-semialdehyde dehydrogenase / glutarate-semialdehyde dehydrogenase
VLGGEIPKGQAPIIRRLCLPMLGIPAYEEELFNPVASVIRADSKNAAIATANDSALGLGGGVITGDIARGERIAAEIESGNVFVNDNVRSDPRLPFGGVKQSDYGRELSQ